MKECLDELVRLGFLELKENGDYVVIKKVETTVSDNKLVIAPKEQPMVDEIIDYVISLNKSFSKNIKKHYIGVVYLDNIFNFTWISRNKKTSKKEKK